MFSELVEYISAEHGIDDWEAKQKVKAIIRLARDHVYNGRFQKAKNLITSTFGDNEVLYDDLLDEGII